MTAIRTVCTPNCCNSCGILAHAQGGRIVKLEPAPFPDPRYTRICLKGPFFSPVLIETPRQE